VSALKALADKGEIKPAVVAKAIAEFGIDPDKSNPLYL
jgi:pyruvate dehydrogenase E1 component